MAYQPMPAAGTTTMVVGPTDWTTSVFDCFSDFGSCLDNYFCAWCANARQWDAVDGRPDSLNILIFLANCCFGTTYLFNCCVRCNIVSKFNLDENSFISFCFACWLPWCVMCQNHRELSNRGYFPGGFCCDPPAGYIQSPAIVTMGAAPVMVQQPSPVYAQQPAGMVMQQQPVMYQQPGMVVQQQPVVTAAYY